MWKHKFVVLALNIELQNTRVCLSVENGIVMNLDNNGINKHNFNQKWSPQKESLHDWIVWNIKTDCSS